MFLACIPRKMLLTSLVKGIPEENKVWKEENKFNFQHTIWDAPEHLVEKTLESPLGIKKIKPVSPKGNQPWIFIGRTDDDAEAPILWPPDAKSWLIGKVPDAGKDWGQEERGMTGDEMVEWHHRRDGHEFEQTLKDCEGQGSLACCSPWSCKESDMTEQQQQQLKTSM